MAGGGVHGMVDGIDPVTMTAAGLIIRMSQDFTMTWIRGGGFTTGTVTGMDITGTMNGLIIDDLAEIGRGGIIIDIGSGNKPGVSRTIVQDHRLSDRS